ncbi:hypothetical protein GGE65_002359 [Skermanella aerolata]|uniref:Uncharacterized protein n=1 Tax=Skermanella aerolata TaxID=393310 RepID=A0A512DQH3_9PROT|nr:hypothetical protein [Skermanella aerolata]GEO38420.1 hypothetical protein SAE02_25680 [Skermanella aerolata]
MDQEFKSMLSLLLGKVDVLNDKIDNLSLEVSAIKKILPNVATKDDIAHLTREQESLEQIFGATHQIMVGHVEQLTRQYEYLVGVRSHTAAE